MERGKQCQDSQRDFDFGDMSCMQKNSMSVVLELNFRQRIEVKPHGERNL
jgi:hypothetical protein